MTAESDGMVRLLVVVVPDPEFDDESTERLGRQLRQELVDLDVESVAPAQVRPAPDGAKGDPIALGALLVAVSSSGGALTALVNGLSAWLERHRGRHRISVTIDGDTIELNRASAEQQQALVDAYILRHSAAATE